MSELSVRRFEYAADGSELSEIICETVLAPAADALCGSDFRCSPAMGVEQEKSLGTADETIMTLGFSAIKTHYLQDEERIAVMYNAYLAFMRPRSPYEHWPDAGISYGEEDNEQAEDDCDETLDEDYVQEMWEYIIDDADYEPRRDVSYEYYQDGEHICTLNINGNPKQASMLSEDIEEDIALSAKDASFATTYSDFDIEMIEAILSFDFLRVRHILDQLGVYHPVNDPYKEALLYSDEDDLLDGNDET